LALICLIKEHRIFGEALYSKMDDWIIYGIKLENNTIYDHVIFFNLIKQYFKYYMFNRLNICKNALQMKNKEKLKILIF